MGITKNKLIAEFEIEDEEDDNENCCNCGNEFKNEIEEEIGFCGDCRW